MTNEQSGEQPVPPESDNGLDQTAAHEGFVRGSGGDPTVTQRVEPQQGQAERAESDAADPRKTPGAFSRMSRRVGSQASRIVLLAAIVAMFGMGVGYALGFPLRYVDYKASSAISLDQASLAGTVDVSDALVTQEDLGQGWTEGDPALAAFGVLGADVCGTEVPTPTPLSAKEAAVWADNTNNARIISQTLRVDKWSAAEQYIDEVAQELEECDTFFRTDGEKRIKVTSRDIERDPPVTDHVDRRYQSPSGVQDWSMFVVGDVIVAIQYLAPTPSPEGFLYDVERSVLERVAAAQFAPGGVDTSVVDGSGGSEAPGAGSSEEPTEPPAAPPAPGDEEPGAEVPPTTAANTGAADESGGD